MFQFLTQFLASQKILATFCSVVFSISFAVGPFTDDGSRPSDSDIEGHLKFGEISKAIELVDRLSDEEANDWLSRISALQAISGNSDAAVESINRISDDRVRYRALFQRGIGPAGFGASGPRGNNVLGGRSNNSSAGTLTGLQGGVTQADFQPLINLIKSTIDPDSWDDVNGDGSILAYPTGVFVDASGALKQLNFDSKRNLRRLAKRSKRDLSEDPNLKAESALRKISLNRLERQAQILAAQGRSLPQDMLNLAGIYHVKYVMLLPESNDIVIAGPAGPWRMDNDGHFINAKTGKPVVQLDDLIACLRNAQQAPLGNAGKFGCAITPRKQNLAATKKYMSTSKLKGKAWRKGLREQLGKQDISVFGMDPSVHAGRVLIEADYRMKLVAMGIEPTIPEIPSYMQRIKVGPDGSVSPMDVVRLWFTMNYDEVLADAERSVFELRGTGVQVLSENEFINDDGDRIHTGQADGPTAGFARDFTRHFEAIATKYPIYWRLKNLFDMAIVASIIRGQHLDQRANWHMTYFGNEPEFVEHSYRLVTAPVPREVDSVMNHRTISIRKPTSTIKHTLIGVSGGIVFDSRSVLQDKARVVELASELSVDRDMIRKDDDDDVWWWD